MLRNSRLTRTVAALGISAVINVVWLGLDGILARNDHPRPMVARMVDILGTSGAAVADLFAPSGHSVGAILGGALRAIGSSVIAYGALAWVVFSVPVWWVALRRTAGPK
jgi:hypothetical protein